MKHFMQPRNPILREKENHAPSEITPSPNPKQRSASSSRKHKWSKENNPPSDPIAMLDPPLFAGKPSPATAAAKIKSPLPPRPPSSKPLKRKFSTEAVPEHGSSDSGVKVVVRVRPPTKDEEEEELVVQKISGDSLSINGHTFTFDSVADNDSTQLDIFQLVGAPLVENCLAGFNSSVFAYGQTGSGKTYTMWGPANALLEENTSDQQGLTPRVFEHLFSRIDEEQNKNGDKQVIYQCRCSFLEIYNEQITDLLNPSQGNLQIREDVKSGVYVENLTEECVSSLKDVTHLFLKGLSNRRTGATSMNAESSRSHSVFTCVVESRSKSPADGLSCCKASRINLVDLAGSERQKLTGAAGERLKEAGNINRSLSQLGNLINILAEVSKTGKQRHIPYRDSRLTFLLQESLGGNAKLAMVCAISPAQSCKSETLSTLRFAQHAKSIKNKAVVNEEMQDDVNSLRAVIRQLKDELLRMKEKDNQSDPSGGYSTGWNARRSLNLLKFSLNRPMILPSIDDDSDEEMEIVEEADEIGGRTGNECPQVSRDTDVIMEEDISEQADKCEISAGGKDPSTNSSDVQITDIVIYQNVTGEKDHDKVIRSLDRKSDGKLFEKPSLKRAASFSNLLGEESPRKTVGSSSRNVLQSESPGQPSAHEEEAATSNTPPNPSGDQLASSNLSPLEVSPVLRSPTPSVSPRVNDTRKSLRTSKDNFHGVLKSGPEAIHMSFAKAPRSSRFNTQSFQANRSCFPPTESLAASLQRGLDIIDGHRQSSALRGSSFRFPCKQADLKPISAISKVSVGVQTLPEENELEEEDSEVVLCSRCKSANFQEDLIDVHDNSSLQIVPVSVVKSVEKTKKTVPKAVEKVLAGAIRREMALEEFCAKQTAEIMQLNRLVQQYKHERECNSIIGHSREDKIVRLENLMDGILPTEEFMEDELLSLTNEHKLLKEKYENHPEVLRTEIELKRVQDELEQYRNFFDMGERDVLLEEINDLRSQLQYYLDSSSMPTRKQSPVHQLTYSCDSGASKPLCTIRESTEDNIQQNRDSTEDSAQQKLEQERIQWTEAESKWISLAEDLKIELESSRSVAEKLKHELHLEKKCSEELKEAMQMAMEGHARMLEQYADLEEKHMEMLARQRQILDGIDDVKKAAAKAGVRGAESRFINALAAEISVLKAEREKERRYFRDENKGLQVQLRDTAEAVQAAGELLVRLKEAEEAVATAEMRAAQAEEEAEKAYKLVNKLKRKHDKGISHDEPHLPKKGSSPIYDVGSDQLKYDATPEKDAPRPIYTDSDVVKYDAAGDSCNTGDHLWLEEFEPSYNPEEGEVTKLAEPSWFTDYDRCNI